MIPACRQTVLLPFLLKSRGESSSCASRAASTSTLSSAGRAAPPARRAARALQTLHLSRAPLAGSLDERVSPPRPPRPHSPRPPWGLSSCVGLEHWSGNPSTCVCDDLSELAGGSGERRGSQVSGRAKEAGEVHDMFSYLWGVSNCEGGEEGWRGVIRRRGGMEG